MSRLRDKLLGALSGDAPAAIRVQGNAPGVLAFHGFGGTTREVELCTEVAEEVGLAALARLLPGHGSHARELAKTRFADWVAGAESAYQELAASGPVIAAGISMGSLMAAHLAIAAHVKSAIVTSILVLAAALWRGFGVAPASRPSWLFMVLLWAAAAALTVTGYRGGQNVYRYGIGVSQQQ